jgi:hypothetical protein
LSFSSRTPSVEGPFFTTRKSGNTIDLYTTFSWEILCAEVAKLKVQRHEHGRLARLACWRPGCCYILPQS